MIDGPLAGARIALTGARKAQESADFVTRLGGFPIVVPSLSTTAIDPAASASATVGASEPGAVDPHQDEIERLLGEDVALFIFLTGVGARAFFRSAEAAGRFDQLRARLDRAAVVVRGPKALGALKGAGFRVDWMPNQATVEAILAGLNRFEVRGRSAVVQLSGFADPRIRDALEARGATVSELNLYQHAAPTNEALVLDLIDQLTNASIDFLTFTSAIGVREFFGVAERHERDDELLAALLGGKVVTAAVGPVTAAALAEAGAPAQIVPDTHTTGGMLRAIADWIASHPR